MSSVQHTVTATVNPTAAPPSVGAHYINTATKQRWLSSGIESVNDWGHPLPGTELTLDVAQLSYTIDLNVPRIIWPVNPASDYEVKFGPPPEAPGYYEVDLIFQPTIGADLQISMTYDNNWLPGLNFDIPDPLYIFSGAPTLVRLGLWVSPFKGLNPYWRLIENRPLDEAKPGYGGGPENQGNMLFLPKKPQTFWDSSEGFAKRLVLPSFGETFATDLFSKVDLVIRNSAPGTLVVTIDEDLGFPLMGAATLSVPSGVTMLFRLAYFIGYAQHSWSLLSTHQLTPDKV
ncbi:hypothetical protein [Pseudomonas huanghezhanensis]|uniref:hypothetical protein n=1 Tax=Pseudomonas huanghezhanensis TaxID=3002903 RepID=UPI002285A953|nr:hypothetical protein [Pseudomonas sp. BSw22131]